MRPVSIAPTPIWARLLALAALMIVAGPASAQAVVGGSLQNALAGAAPSTQLEVVVTYDQDGPLTVAQVSALNALGVSGFTFESLPIAGALATPAQIGAIAGLDGVGSVWLNEQLTYFNGDARALTGVDRLRTEAAMRNRMGMPFSGRGVGVVVNDSGVDGTHPDLRFGQNLKQNVLGTTNLNGVVDGMLPITYTEGVISTDTNSGHGTHCAGTIGGTGAQSNGLHAGVAPGADLVGYGSGGVLFILDAIGGLDYALTHQFQYGIRVTSNSWGTSGPFEPANPVNAATYRLYQRGIVSVFAAGNDGPGEDTHNPYAQAPWVISVGAGNKSGTLADFSSRGLAGETSTFQTYDGVVWTQINEPSLVAPGVDIISACAAGSPLCALGIQEDNPFYTSMQGTSMATPHVAGIIALLLEAKPTLGPGEVKSLLRRTATNMPGRETWEVGTGYVNAYAAITEALGLRADFGTVLNAGRSFNANVDIEVTRQPISIDFNPQPVLSADGNRMTFTVAPGISLVSAKVVADGVAGETGNLIYPVLIAPDGTEYSGGTTLLFPLGFDRLQAVSSPMPGTWTLEIRGIQSGTGQNVASLPEQVDGTLSFQRVNGISGASDIDGHPAAGAIVAGIDARLLDSFADGTYRPTAPLTRAELAEYLVVGGGVRQHRPIDGSALFGDVSASLAPFAEAVSARGAAIRDGAQRFDGVVRSQGGAFNPTGTVTRADLAYSLVQTLAGQAFAESFSGDVTVRFRDENLVIDDQDQIPAELRGYVQLALELGILNARFSVEQGPYDLFPTVHARFAPSETVDRAQFAVSAFATHQRFLTGTSYASGAQTGDAMTVAPAVRSNATTTGDFALRAPAPNPAVAQSRIAFSLAATGPARLAVYDVLGREVAVLAEGELADGAHEVSLDTRSLSAGTYVLRLNAGPASATRQLTVVR